MAAKCETSEPVNKPTAIVDQHLDQNILKCIIHQIKSGNIRKNTLADGSCGILYKFDGLTFCGQGVGKVAATFFPAIVIYFYFAWK